MRDAWSLRSTRFRRKTLWGPVTAGDDATNQDQARPIAMTAAEHARDMARRNDLFGHPRGLTFLFATEMWERFSYYGMRALLVLYMVKYLLQPGHAETVIGLGALRGILESIFGPLGVQPLSSHIYGFYTGFVYFTPLIGGLISARLLGQHRTIIIGAALM